MDNDQARKLVALHDNADRALLNLRNANSMATDDPRAPELLSEAGDAYAEAHAALLDEQAKVVQPHMKARVTIADREDAPQTSSDAATGPQGAGPGPTGVSGDQGAVESAQGANEAAAEKQGGGE